MAEIKDAWDMSEDEIRSALEQEKSSDEEESKTTEQPNEDESEELNDESEEIEDKSEESGVDSIDEEEVEITEDTDTIDSEEQLEESDIDEKEQSTDVKEEYNLEDIDKFISSKPIRANGMDIPVKSYEELTKFAQMGFNYAKKMNDIAPYRKTISAIKEYGLTDTDIGLLIDAKKGNKEAITQLLKDTKIDPMDLNIEDSQYQKKTYGDDEVTINLKEIEAEISKDQEYSQTYDIISNQWDNKSRQEMFNNPSMIKGLHEDVKSGVYTKVAPEAARLKVLDNNQKSELEYYIMAGKMLFNTNKSTQNSNKLKKPTVVRNEKIISKKRAAAPTKSKATVKVTETPDYWNMSNEQLEKIHNELIFKG